MANNTLVIISVPFHRNTRYLLSSELYPQFRENYDLLLVTSFKVTSSFKNEFGGKNVQYCEILPHHSNRILSALYNVSELLRGNGYKFRHRNNRIKYHWYETRFLDFSGGKIEKKSSLSQMLALITGIIGFNPRVWKFFDSLFGQYYYKNKAILDISSKYDKSIIIHTANFSFQERLLGYLGRLAKIKSILIPYTTDQICINGYLIREYDVVCAQGSVEENYLKYHHKVHEDNIFMLGSLWFRNLDRSLSKHEFSFNETAPEEFRTILYAGISSTYFPRYAELVAVDRILHEIEVGTLGKCKLIYRPVCKNNEINEIENRYAGAKSIVIQKPSISMIGMTEDIGESGCTVDAEIYEYSAVMNSISLVIVSQMTTILFDAVYLDKLAISYIYNDSPEDKIRNDYYIDSDCFDIYSAGIPIVVDSLDELAAKVMELLTAPRIFTPVKHNMMSGWHRDDEDTMKGFMLLLDELIHAK